MTSLLQTGLNGHLPPPPEKRFLISCLFLFLLILTPAYAQRVVTAGGFQRLLDEAAGGQLVVDTAIIFMNLDPLRGGGDTVTIPPGTELVIKNTILRMFPGSLTISEDAQLNAIDQSQVIAEGESIIHSRGGILIENSTFDVAGDSRTVFDGTVTLGANTVFETSGDTEINGELTIDADAVWNNEGNVKIGGNPLVPEGPKTINNFGVINNNGTITNDAGTIKNFDGGSIVGTTPDNLNGGTVEEVGSDPVGAAFGDVEDLDQGWMRSDWLGNFNTTFFPWIFHVEHSWTYVFEASTPASVFQYDLSSQGWFFTSSNEYPNLYNFSRSSWVFYFKETTGPRQFADLQTGEFFSLD